MMRCVLGLCLAAGVGFVVASAASAQTLPGLQGNNFVRPPTSPYLNMDRGGNPAVNYYGLVKPQFDTSKQLQTLQQQLQQQTLTPQLGTALDDDGMLSNFAATGHPAVFFAYSHYYGPVGVRPGQAPAATQKK
jgi:hypothetical protein